MSEFLYSAVTAKPTSAIWPMSVLQTQSRFKYDELAVARRFPAVKLVYKESDLKPTGGGDESNDGDNSDDDEKYDEEEEDDDNGASSPLRHGGLFLHFCGAVQYACWRWLSDVLVIKKIANVDITNEIKES